MMNYNNAPMMNNEVYNFSDGYDLNQCTLETLKDFSDRGTIIWLTRIMLLEDDGIMPSGQKYHQKKIYFNQIIPCRIVNNNSKWYIKNVQTIEFNALRNDVRAYDDYEFESINGFYDEEFKENSLGFYELPKNIHASESYEFINRYRYETEKELKTKEETILEKESTKKEKKTSFTITEAKKALSKIYNIPTNKIKIELD